jgi:hypothetical protein
MTSLSSPHHALAAALAALIVLAPAASAQQPRETGSQRAAAKAPAKPATPVVHKLAIQVNDNRPEVMNLALNNAKNVLEYYKSKGERAQIEIVTFGPGLHMLRTDTSPVTQRIAQMALEEPDLKFIACANTHANQSKQEQKTITLVGEAKLYPSGVVRLMELQKQGWAYVRP